MRKPKITSNIKRQITSIGIDADLAVSIGFTEIVPNESEDLKIIDPKSKGNGTDGEEEVEEMEETPARVISHTVDAPYRPHKDFIEAIRGLKKHVLAICEMPGLSDFSVCKLNIDGDVLLRQSRVVMTVSKHVKSTDKEIKFKTPQVTMYGESEYAGAEAMSKVINEVIDEAWKYIDGKYSPEEGKQLPLFARQET